jgi:hypothetical protein
MVKKLWGDVNEATAILSENAGREIDASYVRSLVRAGKVEARQKDGRTNEYNLEQIRKIVVRTREGQRVEERVRDRRSGKPGGRPRKNVQAQGEKAEGE